MGTQNEAELDIQNEVELLEREIFLTALCPDSNLTLLISFAGKACSKIPTTAEISIPWD